MPQARESGEQAARILHMEAVHILMRVNIFNISVSSMWDGRGS